MTTQMPLSSIGVRGNVGEGLMSELSLKVSNNTDNPPT